MSGTTRRIIGFDRKIRLSWLDATAEWTMQGLSTRVGDLSRSPRLELCRQGLDEDVVMLKAMSG